MTIWSKFSRPARTLFAARNILLAQSPKNILQVRRIAGDFHHDHMIIQTSRFQWIKFKALMNYYVFIGLFPILLIIFYFDVLVGPSTLEPIPENYRPKHWEYHRHPISRFIAEKMYPSPQQEYEKILHHLFEENEKSQIRLLESQIREIMYRRNDYKSYYYRPVMAKYYRISKESSDFIKSLGYP